MQIPEPARQKLQEMLKSYADTSEGIYYHARDGNLSIFDNQRKIDSFIYNLAMFYQANPKWFENKVKTPSKKSWDFLNDYLTGIPIQKDTWEKYGMESPQKITNAHTLNTTIEQTIKALRSNEDIKLAYNRSDTELFIQRGITLFKKACSSLANALTPINQKKLSKKLSNNLDPFTKKYNDFLNQEQEFSRYQTRVRTSTLNKLNNDLVLTLKQATELLNKADKIKDKLQGTASTEVNNTMKIATKFASFALKNLQALENYEKKPQDTKPQLIFNTETIQELITFLENFKHLTKNSNDIETILQELKPMAKTLKTNDNMTFHYNVKRRSSSFMNPSSNDSKKNLHPPTSLRHLTRLDRK